ncbi:hypothetical protein KAR91_62845 [Candidatus Pacearchaeota archaeon]|nr:hypothetical protein [Candidatus Pacearchaeota archaeon]
MPKELYAGRGAQAVKRGSQLEKDVTALSDKEKLEKKVAAKQKAIRDKGSSAWKAAQKSTAKRKSAKKKKTENTPKALRARAKGMRNRAKAVEASGTGNKRAAETYRQAARELLARIPKGK